MKSKTIFRWVAFTVLLAPLAVISTTPTPPPYFEYRVYGRVVRGDGGSLNHIPVGLAASEWDGSYRLLTNSLALTTPNGNFALSSVVHGGPLDSIVSVIVLPDTFVMGAPFDARSPESTHDIEDFWVDDGGFFCTDEEKSRVVGTTYFFPFDSLVVDSLP